jgi:hypothetical protein
MAKINTKKDVQQIFEEIVEFLYLFLDSNKTKLVNLFAVRDKNTSKAKLGSPLYLQLKASSHTEVFAQTTNLWNEFAKYDDRMVPTEEDAETRAGAAAQ